MSVSLFNDFDEKKVYIIRLVFLYLPPVTFQKFYQNLNFLHLYVYKMKKWYLFVKKEVRSVLRTERDTI